MLSCCMSWDPHQYLKFSQSRLRPAIDLLARVGDVEPRLVCDLGCGTGQVTALLLHRWPSAHVIGVDASAQMLALAFEAEYAQRLQCAYPPLPDGSTLFPFRRLFIVARKR